MSKLLFQSGQFRDVQSPKLTHFGYHPDKQTLNEQNESDNQIDLQNFSHQPSYLFLRNLWQGKYCNKRPIKPNTEDQIDKINKMVAMMKTRINLMTQKQFYLYQKQTLQGRKNYQNKIYMIQNINIFTPEEQNILKNQYIYSHPIFMRVKQELEKYKMFKEELQDKLNNQTERIDKLLKQKKQCQNLFQSLNRKNKQNQKKIIQISNKNINLEHQIFTFKYINQKIKINDSKQNASPFLFSYLSKQSSAQKPSIKPEQAINQKNQYGFQTCFANVKIHKKFTCTEHQIKFTSENQQRQILKQNYNEINHPQSNDKQSNILPMRFKYIKHEGSGRKALLNYVKSVDISDNTSITKPKFQRTKPTFSHLLEKQGSDSKDSEQKLFQRLKKKAIGHNNKNLMSPNKQYYIRGQQN